MDAKRRFSDAFETVIIICCLIGILSNIFRTTSIPSLLSFYTMQSNIAVLTFYFISKIIKQFKSDWKNTEVYFFFKGAILMIILLTFFVYIVALSPTNFTMDVNTSSEHVLRLSNIFVHFINPILVLLDYLIFDEKGHFSTKYPFKWLMFPVMYLIYVYTYSYCGGTFFGSGGSKKYAYFFLDVDKIGLSGVIKYLIIIAIVYITLCYLLVLLDKVFSKRHKN